MLNSAKSSLNLTAQSQDPVVHVEKSRGKAEMVRPTLPPSLSAAAVVVKPSMGQRK